jgi:hypothetical protein
MMNIKSQIKYKSPRHNKSLRGFVQSLYILACLPVAAVLYYYLFKTNMKIIPSFLCRFIAVISFITVSNSAHAQKGILPLTGMKYFNEGITAKSLNIKIDGTLLVNNRLPLNKEIEISIEQPSGFKADNYKTMFAAAEVVVLSPTGQVLFNNPNVLIKHYSNGFYENELKTFSIKFGIGTDIMKGNQAGTVKVRLYDMKGKGQLRLEMPATFARPGESVQVSKTAKPIKTAAGEGQGMIMGLKAKGLQVELDTTIKVAPKMAYTSLVVSKVEGSSIAGIFGGKEKFWVYDSDLNELKITDILLKKVQGAMESDMVDYTLKIPYRLKTSKADKTYFVRFRWESADRSQLIDVVVAN